MSVASPMPRTNSAVDSTIGTRRLRYPYWAKVSRVWSSMCCQSAASSGSTSFMPRTAWIVGAPMRLSNRLDVDRLSFRLEVGRGRFAAVGRAHVIGDDLLEFLGDAFALEGDGFLPIDEDRGDGHFARARKADSDVGHLRFARTVHDAAHHRHA